MRARLAGICLAAGGPTSHVAILAAAMGVPTLVALGPAVLVCRRTARGSCSMPSRAVSPSRRIQTALAAAEQIARGASSNAGRPSAQRRTPIAAQPTACASTCSRISARSPKRTSPSRYGAEGCGLLRTEFLFLERDSPPDEDEQARQYQSIATRSTGRPLTVRTLDIGGDKPIPYLPMPAEANPALGLRGVRTSLWRPDLLRVQLRAILRVQPARSVPRPVADDHGRGRDQGGAAACSTRCGASSASAGTLRIGAMIETPAAALAAERLAREVDFLSIGTNDLTQYTLAMDRGHAELAHRIDGLHPAVLRLIAMTVDAADAAFASRRRLRRSRLGSRGRAGSDRPRRARALGRADARAAAQER